MADIAEIGIEVDSKKLISANKELAKFSQTGTKAATTAQAGSKKITKSFDSVSRSASTSASSAQAGGKKITNSFDSVNNSIAKARNTFGLFQFAIASLGVGAAIRSATNLSDSYTSIQNRLKVVTDSTEELSRVQGKLAGVAQRSRSDIEGIATLYSRMSQSVNDLGLSEDRLIRITETITKSFALSGANATEAAGAIRQLSQGFASGVLRGEEFNSVAEQAPDILRAVARETGKTYGALREFAADGGITVELLIRSLENYAEVVDKGFAESKATIADAMTDFRNKAILAAGESQTLSDAMSSLSSTISFLANNLDKLDDILVPLIAIMAGRFVGAMGAATIAMIKANGAAVVLRRSLALLGGPVGIIALVAAELYMYSQSADNAAMSTQKMIDQMGRAESIISTQQKIKELTESIENFGGTTKGAGRSVNGNRLALKSMNEELENQKRILKELESGGKDSGATIGQKSIAPIAATKLVKEKDLLGSVIMAPGLEPLTERNLILERYNELLAEAETVAQSVKTPLELFNEEISLLNELRDTRGRTTDEGLISQEQYVRAVESAQDRLSDATKETADEMTLFMEEAAKNIQNMFADNLFDIMQGQFEFTADGFKKMLDRMVADAIAADIAKSLFGTGGKGGGGLLGSIFGGGGAGAGSGFVEGEWDNLPKGGSATGLLEKGFNFAAGFFGGGKANGGDVMGGTSYMVGERGPELFTPKQSGAITPNDKVSGGSVVVNINVSGVKDEGSLRQTTSQIAMNAGMAVQRSQSRNG